MTEQPNAPQNTENQEDTSSASLPVASNEQDTDTAPDASKATDAPEVSEDAQDEGESDNYLEYLVEEHRRYRLVAIVLAVLGVSTILICLTLIQAGIIPNRLYGVIMSVGNLFIVFMAVVIFTRTRPFKRRIKEYTGQPKSKIRDENAADGVLIEDRGPAPDMDFMYRILERGVRTELVVETEEYQKLRKQWLTVFISAGVVAVVACALYLLFPATNIVASLMMIAAFVLVIIGFYIDRTKMKPLRNAYAQSLNMTEFQIRNKMRDYDEKGNLRN